MDPHVILHKDSITLYDDLHGLSTVKGYFQASSFDGLRLVTLHSKGHTVSGVLLLLLDYKGFSRYMTVFISRQCTLMWTLCLAGISRQLQL